MIIENVLGKNYVSNLLEMLLKNEVLQAQGAPCACILIISLDKTTRRPFCQFGSSAVDSLQKWLKPVEYMLLLPTNSNLIRGFVSFNREVDGLVAGL